MQRLKYHENYLLSKKGHVNYSGVVLRFATAFGLSPNAFRSNYK